MRIEDRSPTFDDPDFESRIEELLERRAQEIDLSGFRSSELGRPKASIPTRARYLVACVSLSIVVSAAFFVQFGRSSDTSGESDVADSPDIGEVETVPTTSAITVPVGESVDFETADVQGIVVNVEVADDLEALLEAAEADGITFSGEGYRSVEAQVALRRQNCGVSDYAIQDMPASECAIPTAIPGTSKHEYGLAVDFTVGGEIVEAQTEAHEWLLTNASIYGMVGHDDEPWHWEFGNIEPGDLPIADGEESSEHDQDPDTPEDLVVPDDVPIAVADADLRTINGITVHADIAEAVEAMVEDARQDGIELTGEGYRDPQLQIEMRKKNCGPTNYDIYQKPASLCSPPTARPGVSLHEQAKAIDFMVDDVTPIGRESPEYGWLVANAERYGLRNLPSEPWHWSTNGR